MFDGTKLKQARQRKGLSVFALAAELYGVGHQRSTPTLRAWETGKRQPRVNDLAILAKMLDVDISDLMEPADDTPAQHNNGVHAE